MEFTCLESGFREPGVKQERDSAENGDSEMIPPEEMIPESISEGNTLIEDIKYEATSDDDNDNTQMSDNIQCHNTQVLSYPQCINKYDDMIDIEDDTQTSDDIKFDISEMLHNVGRNQESSDEEIPLTRLRSRKRVKLNEDTESDPALKIQRGITSSHRRGNTGPAVALHSCPHCNYNTINKYHLKEHLLKHTGEKPFSCDQCNYKCILKSYLKRHLLRHTGEKPFLCNSCDYKCSLKGHLKRHLLTHTGEKPFSCNKCDYKCTQKSNLKQHLLTHTGEKPFSCNSCDYKCSSKGQLKRHLLTQNGEKQFSCNKCDYKCTQKSNLKSLILKREDTGPSHNK